MTKKSTSVNRDGDLYVIGSFNYKGSLIKLKEMIDGVINEYGEDTECKLDVFGSFPHRHTAHIILTNKK